MSSKLITHEFELCEPSDLLQFVGHVFCDADHTVSTSSTTNAKTLSYPATLEFNNGSSNGHDAATPSTSSNDSLVTSDDAKQQIQQPTN